ncbi:MAG: c-type cytochrome [Acetobacteraceae bacterium]
MKTRSEDSIGAKFSLIVTALFVLGIGTCQAASPEVARGRYLVTVMGCTDCHTPGSFFGRPDKTQFLGGSDVGFAIPGLGVFVPPNLTPDRSTGLGKWSPKEIVKALTTGVRPDGRILAPIMPWPSFAHLSPEDALAIARYLKSLPSVVHQVPGPFRPGQTPTLPVMAVIPGSLYATLPATPAPKSRKRQRRPAPMYHRLRAVDVRQ